MKLKKKSIVIQPPVLIAVLVFFMIASMWCLLMLLPKTEEKPLELIGSNDVRSGNQMISVSLVEPGTIAAQTPIQTSASGSQLVMETSPAIGQDIFWSAEPTDDKVRFRIDRFQKLAVQPLKFELFDDTGTALTPDYLKSTGGNKLHFYLVHANLKEFHHVFPDFANNVWNISINMPTPGTYYAYLAYEDLYGTKHVYRSDLIVRNESPEDTARPDPTSDLEFFDGSRTAKLTMQRMEVGRFFALDLSRGEEPLNPEPYLESTGHFTLFKHGEPNVFAGAMANVVKAASPNPVFFETPVLTPGRYTAFAEIKLEGKVYVFPLTFDIGTL